MLNSWANIPTKTIWKAHERWSKKLDLMLKDNGGNRHVEKERGKFTNDPTRDNEY